MDRFLERFNLLAQAPDGIKRLREIILQLAVQGELVAQDPSDEPASVLLERIAKEKEMLVKEGKISKQKKLPPITEDEKLFEVPIGWEWCRLQSICSYIQRGKSPKYSDEKSIPVISQKCIQWVGLDMSKAKFIKPSTIEKYKSERFLIENDLLWNSTGTGTIGRITKFKNTNIHYNIVVADSHVTVIRPHLVNSSFVEAWISSPSIQNKFDERFASGSTNQKELALATVISLLVPVPPLNEQKRIIERVQSIMALCDQVKAMQGQTEKKRIEAHKAALHDLGNAQSPDDFESAWKRVLANWDTLLEKPEDVTGLRQAILQLAVQGKLVPQDPADESASVLLEKIATEKAQLINEKKIRKQKQLPPVSETEKSFELPTGWTWTRFLNVVLNIQTGPFGSMLHKYDYITRGIPVINPTHMIDGTIIPDSKCTISSKTFEKLNVFSVKENDVLMARRGEVGRNALVTSEQDGWLCGTGSIILRMSNLIDSLFMQITLNSSRVRTYLQGESIGTTMVNLNQNILSKMPIPVPPLNEQIRIVAKVDALMSICDKLETALIQSQESAQAFAEAVANGV